jgi:hypothetical protein
MPQLARFHRSYILMVLIVLMGISLTLVPASATASDGSDTPDVVYVGIYVKDFNEFSVADGTIKASFYLTLRSDTNVSMDDLEITNGIATSVDTIDNQTNVKEYRLTAELNVDPDLHRFPFDRHVIQIEIEPKNRDQREMVLVIEQSEIGRDVEADLPGWEFTDMDASIANKTYTHDDISYSRAVFVYGISRDVTSTVLKFFLPIMLIIIVALSSLMIKISSRLGLNASMFLAAVLIHWRIADSIPLVAYATFLDMFMIITYATLVMVLVSGLLILRSTEAKDVDQVKRVNRWSIKIIPTISLTLYFLLFISLLAQ